MNFLRNHPGLSVLILIGLILLIWILWANTAPVTTRYTLRSSKLPEGFSGLRIAQVSDLHNARFGPENEKLLHQLADNDPDIIAITGDLLDSRRTDPKAALAFAREAMKLAPTYYVPGNHEARLPAEYAALKEALTRCGVVVLENESLLLERENTAITLTGLLDPDFTGSQAAFPDITTEHYHIVLSHRPELLADYARQGYDLVLTGHAHGGQFRLPFVGGLFAPHQGFFPEYDAGLFTRGNTAMVVSRGLGNSVFPLRLGNRPELVMVTLERG